MTKNVSVRLRTKWDSFSGYWGNVYVDQKVVAITHHGKDEQKAYRKLISDYIWERDNGKRLYK